MSKILAHAKERAAIIGLEKQVPSLDGQVAFAQHTSKKLDFAQKQNIFLSDNLVRVIFNLVTNLHACVGQMNFELQILKKKGVWINCSF